MSGILFIVCVPTEQEEISIDNQFKDVVSKVSENQMQNQKSFIENVTVSQEDTVQSAVHLTIEKIRKEHLQIWKFNENSPLQKTTSCDKKSEKIGAQMKKFKLRKSWDESRLTDSKRKTNHIESNVANELNIPTNSSMEVVLKNIFEKLKIENVNWQKCNQSLNATFTIRGGILKHRVLNLFEEWGVGERRGSSVSMVPCTVILPAETFDKYENDAFTDELSAKDQGLWDGFMNSVNARKNVAKIVEELRQKAALTFDYVTLIIIAGIMAAFGLIENSIICLTSSMLISPLMGPLIAATFSTVIKDKQLMKFGVMNELIGICLATFVGFLFGLIVGSIDERYSLGDGLGEEILSRCEIHSLIIGICTAIPSGAAVAIAILSKNIGSLVGVAISASLLPPAVNAGLLWAIAVLFMYHENNENFYNSVVKSSTYSEHQAVELAILGSISMALTIINVICIYVTGILFLKIKEVAPMTSKSQRQFWKHDVKVARDYNNTVAGGEGLLLQERLFEEFAQFQNSSDRARLLRNASNQYTWSPMMSGTGTAKMSIQELEKVYCNLSHTISDESCPTRRLSRVTSKESSSTKYQQLTNDIIENDFRNPHLNSDIPASSTSSPHRMCSKTKMLPHSLSRIVETSPWTIGNHKNTEVTVVECNKRVPSKPKFIVTPAVDPLHSNKS